MTQGGIGKLGAVFIPALAAVDWQWSVALSFGIVSGWFCRAAVPYNNRRPMSEVRRTFTVSIMISGGSLFATLWFAHLLKADTLAVGVIAWAVSFGGLDALSIAYNYVLQPIRDSIGKSPEQRIGEKRDEAQKLKAAVLAAARELEREREAKGNDDERTDEDHS